MKNSKVRKVGALTLIFSMLLTSFSTVVPSSSYAEGITDTQSVTSEEVNGSNVQDVEKKQVEAEESQVVDEVPEASQEEKEQQSEPDQTEVQDSEVTDPEGQEEVQQPIQTEEKVEVDAEDASTEPKTEGTPEPEQEETSEEMETEEPTQTEEPEIDFTKLPELLVTEIMANNVGADQYEYFEVYNNSDKPIVLDHYTFSVRYTDGSNKEDLDMKFDPVTLDSKESLVFWLNVNDKSLADFNEHYGTNLKDENVIDYHDVPGFYNSGDRAVVIKNHQGDDILFANYLGEDIGNGEVVQYSLPTSGIEMEKLAVKAAPTPGKVEAEQVPAEVVILPVNAAPSIEHTPVTSVRNDQDLTLTTVVTDDHDDEATVSLFYKIGEETEFKRGSMEKGENNEYYYVISKDELQDVSFQYYVMVTDQQNRVTYPSESGQAISVKIERETVEEDFDGFPPLLITELSPNSTGGGTDYFEFFEVYNNSNQPLPLANYAFIYKYTDSGTELPFNLPQVTIEPQETLVFWFNNGDQSLDEFNNHFSSNLLSHQVVEFKDVFPGFANGGNRGILIKDNEGNEVVSASYLGSENDNTGADISYKYPVSGTEMAKYQVLAVPTPGHFDAVQVPATPVNLPEMVEDTTAPAIEFTPVSEVVPAFSSVVIEATITDDLAVPMATLFYKEKGAENFRSLSMSVNSDSKTYQATIPGIHVTSDLIYYIEGTDGVNTDRTEEYTLSVKKSEVDFQTLPSFLVTEVVPDTANVGSADGYEFVEIYNNTNADISFKDYKLNYRYGDDPGSDVVWASVPDDVIIPAGETLVFWIINGQNDEQTVADFNTHFGSNLVENQNIVRVYSGGMANGSMRGLVISSNTGKEVAVAYYNDETNVDDTHADKGILYKFPENKSTVMKKISGGQIDATPGSIEDYQKPTQSVQVEKDSEAPAIEDLTSVTEVNQHEDIEVIAKAEDNLAVKSVRLFYKTNGQEQYTEEILKENYDDSLYHFTIYSPNLIGKEFVEYYYLVSDGSNEVTTEKKRISVTNEMDDSSLRINIEDGEVVSGKKVIKATSKEDAPEDVQMFIDGTELSEGLYKSVEHDAYIAVEANGLNTYFKNAITKGDEVLYLMDKDWLSHWKTFNVPISPEQLQVGDNVITVRSGNKASPFDLESAENRDDYDLRNVRLILADGTVLRDGNYSDPAQVLKMNDANPFVDFHFEITENHAHSNTYKWDTALAKDGEHVITVQDKNEEVRAKVLVDNTAPKIETNVNEGHEYKGAFDITVETNDEIAGIENVTVMLDDEKIEVPYKTSSAKLIPGEHKLTILAVDKVGNEAEEIVHFSVVNENPLKPEVVSPSDDASVPVNGDPTLKVKVNDPTGDDMDVSFYQGYKYDVKNGIKGFQHTSETEPPKMMIPEGENEFTTEDIALVGEKDGKYLNTDSTTTFPYQRFDVSIDPSVDEKDLVELEWNGQSLEGRKVSMYAWSHLDNKWELIDYKIAGSEDFSLTGTVSVGEYEKDSNINVLIQDEIPASPDDYDYTFVWMSDTQYYAESYPYIFDRQTQWIAEKQEELKIEYVFHTGDLVNVSTEQYQWKHADEYMKVLDDNQIPYGVLAGNHDVSQIDNDYTDYYNYFGEDRFKDKPYYGGSYLNNRGHYDLTSVDGNDYIMVYLGWGVTDEGIAWMNDVLAAHPDRKAILNFHEYLLATGTRHPLGEKLYNEIVVPNENVIAVLSGHYHEAQTLVEEIDDNGDGTPDRKVYQMLADYQAGPEGGQGYMRLLHFDTDNDRVIVNTFSPYMDDYNFYDIDTHGEKDEFIMELNLEAAEKRVATDYFSVEIFTDTEIGRDEAVPNGEVAETVWTDLTENQTYSWYAVAEDGYTGKTSSDIWTFVKGENPAVDPDPIPDPGSGDEDEEPVDEDNENSPDVPDGGEQPTPDEEQDAGGSDEDSKDKEQESDNEELENDKDEDSAGSSNGGSGSGITLPNTATQMFNYGLVGLVSILLGGLLLVVIKRRKLKSEI